jgi:hypothetical protein
MSDTFPNNAHNADETLHARLPLRYTVKANIIKMYLFNKYSTPVSMADGSWRYELHVPDIGTKRHCLDGLDLTIQSGIELYIFRYNSNTCYRGNDTLTVDHYHPLNVLGIPSRTGCYINHDNFIKVCFGMRRLSIYTPKHIEELYISKLTVWMFGDNFDEITEMMYNAHRDALPVNIPKSLINIITTYVAVGLYCI